MISINLQVNYYAKEAPRLCFRHAVQRAMKGEDVQVELDDYESEYYMGPTRCVDCEKEDQCTSTMLVK